MDERIEHYYLLKPHEFPLVEEMVLSVSGDTDIKTRTVAIGMTCRSRDSSVKRRLHLDFSDVRDMDFRPVSLPDLSVYLDIHLPVRRGWETDDRFEVIAEHFYDAFKFTCGSFEAAVRESRERVV